MSNTLTKDPYTKIHKFAQEMGITIFIPKGLSQIQLEDKYNQLKTTITKAKCYTT